MKILFQLTGSIAAYKACSLISRLKKQGHEVRIACSKDTFEFVGLSTLEGLSSEPVFYDIYQETRQMDHIHLIRWAQLILLCPATANTINQMAAGISSSPIGTLFLAHDFEKPYILVPAMNEKMWQHPATQRSLKKLKEWGLEIFEPSSGELACGEMGQGRLLEPEQILERLKKYL